MALDRIVQSLEFPFPPERVWRAITQPEEVVRWFSDRARLEPVVGGEAIFEWDGHPVSEGVVERFEPYHTFAFRWRHVDAGLEGPMTDGNSTLVTFNLTPTAAGSHLEVVETGFASLPAAIRAKAYQENDGGWKHELAELVEYLT